MKLHSESRAKQRINAYGTGSITVNDQIFTGTIVLGADEVITDSPEKGIEDLGESTCERLRTLEPELVIVGTGEKHRILPATLFASLMSEGIGVDVMSTPAACRTFNILGSEGRKVIALLLPIESS
ncbi:Mth938-like domain-containing protein [Thioalkalivibrio sp. HK1]|uniref:Mth938-like domain-containing protein n=1 Tax=Thioalkalivibrio sp. HK1 TaxID=1469245 RepID=UPI00046F75AF|nr:Mth938-like domain-containing protein [Thioalkalivibrio sp. HK1]